MSVKSGFKLVGKYVYLAINKYIQQYRHQHDATSCSVFLSEQQKRRRVKLNMRLEEKKWK